MKLNEVKNILKHKGLRFTEQRKIVLDILKSSKTPLTAEEIYIQYVNQDKSISLSTIYRTIDAFIANDLVEKSYLQDDQKACFSYNHNEHKHYLVCVDCKRVIEVKSCPLEIYANQLELQTDFNITGHKLELFGHCPDCK
ncbi:Fur family transcriptional regulator [Haloplasma contractile]|uniref:Ferric uptake regulation protein Fur n=1 Tax=Haloplasma contractile SSD-17B TaxID=1033810 RepID=U2FLL7_9MOLU|nr:Fur family transcriptional regulator [Haloplasma contractile]ERJ12074.1 Ferric uptake regulation protein Fur [Haloplasma contractile SSD-17B]